MQPRVPREILQEIRERVSLVEVIGRYVSLQKRGRSHVGLCPFHGEKTPSFHVDEARRMFYCFGCQAGGDVFHFLTTIENQPFMEVVRELAQPLGIELPERELSPQEKRTMDERELLLHLNEVAASYFERQLLGCPKALDYLNRRGISKEVLEAFRIGYAPAGWSGLTEYLQRQRHPLHLAEKAGLLSTGRQDTRYDRFRDRIMFPIRNPSGKVIGFGGRVIDEGEPKYLNSPETPLFNKSEALLGIDQARRAIAQEDAVVVVEGNFDTVALHGGGIRHAVATCGTSLTRQHLRILKRYTRRVVLVYDGDRAGLKAAERSLGLFLEEELWPYFMPLPDGQDPDDLIRAEGGEGFKQRLAKAIPLLDFIIMRQARLAQSSAQEREKALENLAPVLPLFARLRPEKVDYYISIIAQHFGMPDHVVQSFMRELKAPSAPSLAAPGHTLQQPPVRRPTVVLPPHEELLIQWILHQPEEILPAAAEARVVEWLTHPGLQALAQAALQAFQAGQPLPAAQLVELASDEGLRARLLELSIRELEVGEDRNRAMLQSILGIKEKNLHYLLRHVQSEIARLGREGGDPAALNRLLQQKVELNRQKALLQSRSAGAS